MGVYNSNMLVLESLLNASFEGVNINQRNLNQETPLLNFIV